MGLDLRVPGAKWKQRVGSYTSYHDFREEIRKIPGGDRLYPLILNHSDCDGGYTLEQVPMLRWEIETVAVRFAAKGCLVNYLYIISVFIIACNMAQEDNSEIEFC